MKTYIIKILSEAVSNITHMSGTSGNEAILNRETVIYKGEAVSVPVLSGNALRHNIVRASGIQHLLKEYEMFGELSVDQANFLANGGRLSKSASEEDLSLIKEMHEVAPLLKILGGSLLNQVVAGNMSVSSGSLVCEENRNIIASVLGKEAVPEGDLLSFVDFVSKYQYTRGDAWKSPEASTFIKDDYRGDSNLMIYSGESIARGALFAHRIVIKNGAEIELGACLSSLDFWSKQGGHIGGSARIGHGCLFPSISITDTDGKEYSAGGFIKDYREYVATKKDAFRKWLVRALPDMRSLL